MSLSNRKFIAMEEALREATATLRAFAPCYCSRSVKTGKRRRGFRCTRCLVLLQVRKALAA